MRFDNPIYLVAVLVGFIALSLPARAEDGKKDRKFGGPNAVENTLEDDREPGPALVDERLLESWFEWKKGVQAQSGLSFGMDYTTLALASNSDAGDDNAAAAMFRLFGAWDLIGRGTKNTGALLWKAEHRHRYADTAPNTFGLAELNYVGVIGGPYSNQGSRLTNLYWRQRFNEGRTTVIGGYLDVTDYLDVFIGGTPWTGFTNLAFSTGSASVFLPNDASLGVAGATMLTDNFYVIGGITNAFADSTDPFKDSFSDFFDTDEHFMSLEIGWTASPGRIYLDNTHITLWRVDESAAAGTAEGGGIAFSHIRKYGDWMPFLRGGFADDGGSLLQTSVSVGLMHQTDPAGDLAGLGLNWSEVNETTFAAGLDDQITAEAFYRAQITQQFAITPTLQYLRDPALNASEDDIWIFGLRARIAL